MASEQRHQTLFDTTKQLMKIQSNLHVRRPIQNTKKAFQIKPPVHDHFSEATIPPPLFVVTFLNLSIAFNIL